MCKRLRASAGPAGTPSPGGGKSMCFLSYLREGCRDAARANEKKRKEQEGKGGGQLPLHPKRRPAGTSAV